MGGQEPPLPQQICKRGQRCPLRNLELHGWTPGLPDEVGAGVGVGGGGWILTKGWTFTLGPAHLPAGAVSLPPETTDPSCLPVGGTPAARASQGTASFGRQKEPEAFLRIHTRIRVLRIRVHVCV